MALTLAAKAGIKNSHYRSGEPLRHPKSNAATDSSRSLSLTLPEDAPTFPETLLAEAGWVFFCRHAPCRAASRQFCQALSGLLTSEVIRAR